MTKEPPENVARGVLFRERGKEFDHDPDASVVTNSDGGGSRAGSDLGVTVIRAMVVAVVMTVRDDNRNRNPRPLHCC